MTLDDISNDQSHGARFAQKGMSIGGKWVKAHDGKTFEVLNPATETVWSEVPDAGRVDAQAAIEAASKAQPAWAALPFSQRALLMTRIADILERRKDEFVAALTAECGGWIRKSIFEIGYAPTVYRAAAAEAYRPLGETLPSDHGKVSIVERTPLGVVSVISPWNVPLLLSSRGIAVALALGNTVVLKPSEETPVTGGLMIAEVFEEAGVPPGVLNVVTCSRDRVAEVGDELVVNPLVKAISSPARQLSVNPSPPRRAGC
jgi:acyl-CoA reductase-like NAD-dependent aldehyde dehydrogenase